MSNFIISVNFEQLLIPSYLIVPSDVQYRAIRIMPCRMPSGACRLTPPYTAVNAPVGVFIRINSVNVRAKRLCGYL